MPKYRKNYVPPRLRMGRVYLDAYGHFTQEKYLQRDDFGEPVDPRFNRLDKDQKKQGAQ